MQQQTNTGLLVTVVICILGVWSASAQRCTDTTKYYGVKDSCSVFQCMDCPANAVQYGYFKIFSWYPFTNPDTLQCYNGNNNTCYYSRYAYNPYDEACVCEWGYFAANAKYLCGPDGIKSKDSYSGNWDNIYPYPDLLPDSFTCEPCPIGKYCLGGKVDYVYAGERMTHTKPQNCPLSSMTQTNEWTKPVPCACPPGTEERLFPLLHGGTVNCRCPLGQFWNRTASPRIVSCSPCPQGYYCEDGYDVRICPSGWNTVQRGSAYIYNCSICDPQLLSNCAQGSYCKAPTALDTSFSCTTCPVGHSCFKREEPPQKCPPGEYQDEPGQVRCKPCSKGTSSSLVARVEPCTACVPGKFAGKEGMAQCEPCEPGYYQPEPMTQACLSCPPGKYQSLFSATSCVNCPPGYASSGGASTFSGTSTSMESACELCAAGKYTALQIVSAAEGGISSSSSVISTCKLCPPGKYMPFSGSAACIDCFQSDRFTTTDPGT